MPEAPRYHHISSAVVSAMRDVVVHAHEGGKIVVVIEGACTGVMGDCLTRIALLDGVVAANMVFEHIEAEEVSGQ